MCKPVNEENRVIAAETFFHSYQGSRRLSHSVIRFETPVNFSDIKILSPSMYLSTSNGGLILGATDPCDFQVQFFCNNLYRNRGVQHENLGVLNYSENVCTHLTCSNNIWADRLIICGYFLAITVVVYGMPEDPDADSVQERDRMCNIPLMDGVGRDANIMDVPEDFYIDSAIVEVLESLQLDSDSYEY